MRLNVVLNQRKNFSRGYAWVEETGKTEKISYDSTIKTVNEETGEVTEEVPNTNYRMASLEALTHVLEDLKDKLGEVTDMINIYVPSNIYEFITNGQYKRWIAFGKKTNGESVTDEEVDTINKFLSVYLSNEIFYAVMFKDLKTCFLTDQQKSNPYTLKRVSARKRALDKVASKAKDLMDTICPESSRSNRGITDIADVKFA